MLSPCIFHLWKEEKERKGVRRVKKVKRKVKKEREQLTISASDVCTRR
jgi:hypothetical protein